MRVTVIIATMNRAEQVRDLTLSALDKQDTDNFDIIVWDASEGDSTFKVCEESKRKVNYFAAPRKGLAKQRNDAVSKAKELFPSNNIILFLDDDVKLTNDAMSGLIKTYVSHSDISGVGIPIVGVEIKKSLFKKILKSIFLNFEFKKRHMTGYAYGYQVDCEKNSTEVNWLSGCSMSYKIECFEDAIFDERLCKFGGYCLAEDAVFSCTLYRMGKRFMLSDVGNLIHVRDGNSRLDYRKMTSSFLYNKNILFHAINKDKSLFKRIVLRLAFIWVQFYNLTSLFLRAVKNRAIGDYFRGMVDVIKSKE